MADKGYVESLLNALSAEIKGPVTQAFRYVLDNLSIGGVDDGKRAANFRWYRFDATTSTVANQEFSVHHGQGQTPVMCWPVAWLDGSGGRIVSLRVTRAADDQRMYFSSPDTNASISILAEF